MAEENAVLSSQLANMHLQGGHQNWGFNGVETISLKEKLQGALSREFALRVEIDKVSFSNIIYGLLIFLKRHMLISWLKNFILLPVPTT